MIIQASDLLIHSGKFILTAAGGAAIALIINHFYKYFEKINHLKNGIYALLCKFFFTSVTQASELTNHKKQIEDKLKKLEIFKINPSGEEAASIIQDILFDKNITISVSDLSKALFKMRGMKDFQTGDGAILQSFYLANKKYRQIIGYFVRFHEMKRIIKDEPNFMILMLDHFERNMPNVLILIDENLRFTKSTFSSCDELLKKLGKRQLKNWFKNKPRPRPTDFGKVVKLSEYNE